MNLKTDSFGLDEEVIDAFAEIFESTTNVDEVIIFGSRAKGNYSEGSDIDLAVKGKAVFDTVLTLMIEIEKLGLLYKVDIQNYHSITNQDLRDHIQRVGKTFWRRSIKQRGHNNF